MRGSYPTPSTTSHYKAVFYAGFYKICDRYTDERVDTSLYPTLKSAFDAMIQLERRWLGIA